MTFDDWLEEQPKRFHSVTIEAKLRAAWDAGRIEGWIQADRLHRNHYRQTVPIRDIRELDALTG